MSTVDMATRATPRSVSHTNVLPPVVRPTDAGPPGGGAIARAGCAAGWLGTAARRPCWWRWSFFSGVGGLVGGPVTDRPGQHRERGPAGRVGPRP